MSDDPYDTVPKLLLRNARARGERPAMREKDLGIWQPWTWSRVLAEVRSLACGMAELGLRRGDRVAIVGDNRPQLYWAIAAAQSLGAVPVPVYQDSTGDELHYVLEHAEVRFAVLENQEQVDKVLDIGNRLPSLEVLIYDEPRGLRDYRQPFLHALSAVQERGRRLDAAQPRFFEAEIAKGSAEDLAIIVYTSGTTGRPKGVMLSFHNLVESARLAVEFDRITEREEILSYLPMAWVGDHFISYCQAVVAGFCVNIPESPDTVLADLREIGPTYFFAPPRIWENLLTSVMVRMEDAAAIKRRLYRYFMGHANRCGVRLLEGRAVGFKDRLLYRLGELLVYGPLKNTLGFTRIRIAYTAGEALGPDIFQFFRSIGVNLKQLYGQTECSVYLCLQRDDDVRADTVGPPGPGVEVRIDEGGEVLFRCPGVFIGYYKDEQATASAKTADGWVHSGDAGVFTEDGHLRIIDRAKDVGRLDDGTLFSPKYVENKLKFYPYIKEAVAFGHGRARVTALVNMDFEATGSWAERRNLSYTNYADLATRKEVYDLIQQGIEQVNRDLAADPALAGAQVARFVILHKELDPDDGEITRTRKVRRSTIHERYGKVIEALYSSAGEVEVEVPVTFEDGSSGVLRAVLEIRDVRAYEPLRKAG